MSGCIIDDNTFRLLLDLEIAKAQRLRYPVATVCFALDEPNTTSETQALVQTVAGAIRATDCVAWRDSHSVVLLLIDAEASNLPIIIGRLTSMLDIAWSAGGTCYPDNAAMTERLIDQATTMQALAKQDGGRRLYVAKPENPVEPEGFREHQ